MRGVNFLRLGSVLEARDAFDRALKLDASDATARAGHAWCAYLDGNITEASNRLGVSRSTIYRKLQEYGQGDA